MIIMTRVAGVSVSRPCLTPSMNQTTQRTHLDELENQSIFIFREPYHAFKNIAMPWSMGKDSNVMIWLPRKAFFGRRPFPVLHIDTTYELPGILEFREWRRSHHNLNLMVTFNT